MPTLRTGSVGSDWQKVDTDMLSAMSDIEGKDFAAEEAKLRDEIAAAEKLKYLGIKDGNHSRRLF